MKFNDVLFAFILVSVKRLYLQDRKKRILNSDDIIDTMDDSDWEELETN